MRVTRGTTPKIINEEISMMDLGKVLENMNPDRIPELIRLLKEATDIEVEPWSKDHELSVLIRNYRSRN